MNYFTFKEMKLRGAEDVVNKLQGDSIQTLIKYID